MLNVCILLYCGQFFFSKYQNNEYVHIHNNKARQIYCEWKKVIWMKDYYMLSKCKQDAICDNKWNKVSLNLPISMNGLIHLTTCKTWLGSFFPKNGKGVEENQIYVILIHIWRKQVDNYVQKGEFWTFFSLYLFGSNLFLY